MQAQLGASASSPVLAEVTHCHCWSVSVCIRNRGRGANPNLRNRGRRAKPSFSVLQQSPSVTDTGSWLTWDCLYIVWCFLGWVRHWPSARTCQALHLVSDSNHRWYTGEDSDLLPGLLPLLLSQLQTLDFFVSAIRALQQECSHPFSRDHSSYSLETGLRKLHFPLKFACPCMHPRSSSRGNETIT